MRYFKRNGTLTIWMIREDFKAKRTNDPESDWSWITEWAREELKTNDSLTGYEEILEEDIFLENV